MSTKTDRVGAWIPMHSDLRASDLHRMDDSVVVEALGYSNFPMADHRWIRIGEATITVELASELQRTQDAVAMLRREQAELQAKSTQIEAEIQKLLAITYAPSRQGEEVDL